MFQGIELEKKIQGTQYDDPRYWHRIKVLGQRGKAKEKPVWLTLKVVPMTVSTK